MNITSLDNQKVKKLKKLQSKKYRDIEGEFVVEGEHLVLEAYKAGVLEEAFLLDGEENSYDFEVTYCSLEVMKEISSLDTFSKIVGLCKKKEMKEVLGAKILLLDGIQDPGNLGTIIRSSLAFNIDTIILTEDSVDLYNPKVIRSTMGAMFRVKVLDNLDLKEELLKLKKAGYKVVITSLDTNEMHYNLNFSDRLVIVIGNEAKGVKKEIQDLADIKVKIPMLGRTESLNASVAASVIAYEKVRQEVGCER